MTKAQSTYEYQVGGSLNSDALSYVKRQADRDFYEGLKSGQFCYVLNSRQMGKSSLRVRTMQKLQAEGVVCVFIDLTGMGKQDLTPEKWYAGILQSLVSGCQLSSKIPWRTWWLERQDLLSPVQRLSVFFEEILLVEIQQNIVIFIDEIDRVLSQNFSLDDFFGLIRYFYEQRDTHSYYTRLTFALLGVATPSDLIQDKIQTPFNIGKAIQLQGFQTNEVQPLIEGLQGRFENPDAVITEILSWTGGQPFLTQKLCQLLINKKELGSNPQSVEQIVRSYIVDNWEVQDQPQHLRTIRDRIITNEKKAVQLLGLYQKILQQGAIIADGSGEQMALRLSGLVVEKEGQLQVYNPIYEMVFNQNWVDGILNHLRPYATDLAAWVSSESQDQSYLLQGVELQDALTWALGKSLSDVDYKFLVASQELGKRQTEKLLKTTEKVLEATEKASQVLASARVQAKQEVRKKRIWWGWMPLTALAVTAPILLLRFSGLLQGLEWNLLDLFFQLRPPEAIDTRIAIITIDETDLTQVGQWPIPDQILAQAITKINAQNPHSIGLDIYRDLPVEPGHSDLVQVFQATPNLFGMEKVVGNQVKASPVLSQLRQVGFADQVVDGDGKVRRALLSVISDDEVHYSLGLKLALHYLEAQGIKEEPVDPEGHRIRLGEAVFERFTGNDGGYVRTDSGGYQILLNFRGSHQHFESFSLRELLNNEIPLKSLNRRLVLIGTTAESINDLFYTPYSRKLFSSPETMPGVVLHANIVSKILSAALDRRSLLRVHSEPLEWFWILVMAFLGTMISWRFQGIKSMGFSFLMVTMGLFLGCYVAFLWGLWLPLIPSMLALSGSTVGLFILINKKRDRLLLRLTLDLLLETYEDDPTTGLIAIEYLKQSETQENKHFIAERFITLTSENQTTHPSKPDY